MTVAKLITPADYETWNQYVLAHAGEGVYLTTAWKEAVERSYGHQTFYLAAYSDRVMTGVLPLVLVKPPFSKGNLVSLPFCDFGGLLADNEKVAQALLEQGLALAIELRTGFEIRTPVPCDMLAKEDRFAQVTDKCRMVLTLPSSAALLWAGFKSKLRSQVNRAGKDGLICRLGQNELLADFYKVFSRNMHDLGSPVHSVAWLREIVNAYGESAKIGVVYKDNLPLAAGILLAHGNTVTVPWASALREYSKLSPNMLLYWTLLEYTADHGFEFFDFGRSTPEEGTYYFKQQWGSQPIPLHWYRLATSGSCRIGRKRAGNSSLRRIAEKAWQRIPLADANVIGPHLRKYIDK